MLYRILTTMMIEDDRMSILESIFLGIIQGLTEFLPISSSGHISLFGHFFGSGSSYGGFISAMLHIGTLIALVVAFYKPLSELFSEFFSVLKDISSKNFVLDFKRMSETRKMLVFFIISCLPLLVLLIPVGKGENIYSLTELMYTDNSIKAEGLGFMFSGLLVILASIYSENKPRIKKFSPASAAIVGVAQLLSACFPGFSRIGATTSAATLCNVSRKNSIRYALVLSVPVVAVRCIISCKEITNSTVVIPVGYVLLGVLVSAVVGFFSIRLLQLVEKKGLLKYFGIYCVGIGFIASVIGAIEVFVK